MKREVRHLWTTCLLVFMLPLLRLQHEKEVPDVPRFARVADGIYRSGQPNEVGFRQLAQWGIKTVIDLRGAGERAQREKALVESLGMRYVNIPLSGWRRPRDEDVLRILALLADPTHHPVLLHCQRGADRTGLIVALYRVLYEGWEPERAYREMRRFGFRWYLRGMKRYVWEAPPRLRASLPVAIRVVRP